MPVDVEIDTMVDAAYISITDAPVARTVEFNTFVQVDLDQFDCVVGIELLTLTRDWPLREVVKEFHVAAADAEIVGRITNPMLKSPADLQERRRAHPGSGTFITLQGASVVPDTPLVGLRAS